MALTVGSTAQPVRAAATEDEQHPILAWLQAKQRVIGLVAGFVVLVGLVSWYVVESGRRKQAQAADALDRARAEMDGGNYPQASASLQKVATTYAGTDAAFEATLALNQVRMLSGQAKLAVDELRKFAATNPPAPYNSAAHTHLAIALEDTGQPAAAIAEYQKAAELATEDYRKVDALLNVARVERSMGNDKVAVEVLQGVIKNHPAESPGVTEAKVRLAEITRGPTLARSQCLPH